MRIMRNFLLEFRYKKISQHATVHDLLKEGFRKSIHICAAAVPFFAERWFFLTIAALSSILLLYVLFEALRIHGKNIPFISSITRFAARTRDGNGFVFGPVTLALGVIITLAVFPLSAARIGIWAVAFGDGLASLVGKIYGQTQLRIVKDKTIAGSIACFSAVFFASIYATGSISHALIFAVVATLLEALPLKNFDNIVIPLCSAAAAFFLL